VAKEGRKKVMEKQKTGCREGLTKQGWKKERKKEKERVNQFRSGVANENNF